MGFNSGFKGLISNFIISTHYFINFCLDLTSLISESVTLDILHTNATEKESCETDKENCLYFGESSSIESNSENTN